MCYWPQQITHSEISIILYIIRMSNPMIVLLFILKNYYFENMRTFISVNDPSSFACSWANYINLCIN